MIRNLLVAAVFFFGPMLLMILLRNLGTLFRLWLAARRRRRAQPDIIDISPHLRARPSWAFVAVAILFGGICAYWAWQYTQRPVVGIDQRYVPAHLDAHGHLVPGRLVPQSSPPDAGQPSD
jgi:hypothetical protein